MALCRHLPCAVVHDDRERQPGPVVRDARPLDLAAEHHSKVGAVRIDAEERCHYLAQDGVVAEKHPEDDTPGRVRDSVVRMLDLRDPRQCPVGAHRGS